jgi:murein L,D-transpeptidase YcbB/YkuD
MADVVRVATTAVKRVVIACCGGALIAMGAPSSAAAAGAGPVPASALAQEIAKRSDDLRGVYAARGYSPLWMTPSGRPGPAVGPLLARLDTAQFDGLGEKTLRRLRTSGVRRDLRRAAAGDPDDIARAELELSGLFADYVRATRGAFHTAMIYESPALAPVVPTAAAALRAASETGSLADYVETMGWLHPLYAPLRDAMDTRDYAPLERRVIWENLDRVRALPATPPERYVLVDTAAARLWMYEEGKPVDSMKVVVGKPETATPMMAGFIRYAIVNPYWNVPPDLVQHTIAPNVIDRGIGYLKERGYDVLSGYEADAGVIDPKSVDWQAVADGWQTVRVRQRPGAGNFMGKVKYEFPNPQGIYLHDTPDKHLLKEAVRQLSNGCVRLEDADRFGRWLLGGPLPKVGKQPERRIDLPTLVPVYITYLTAVPTAQGIAFADDIYGRDGATRMVAAAR